MRINRFSEDTDIFYLPRSIQTFYAPNTKQTRYRNESERGRFIEKVEMVAQFSLVPETKGKDFKAINVLCSHQTANNKQGFAIESQQIQDELKIIRDFLR